MNKLQTMRAYKFRIYPNKKQAKLLNEQLYLCRQLYNTLLERSREEYRNGVSISDNNSLNRLCNEIRQKDAKYDTIYSQVIQNTRMRLAAAFTNFFRRVKEKKNGKKVKAGFPRFKKFYRSITYPQNNGSFEITGRTLKISRIGSIPIVQHRNTEGEVKTLTIKRTQAGKFYAIFTTIACNEPSGQKTGKEIGIDLGIESFATLSNGMRIENPKYLIKSEKKLRKLQKRLSKKKPGSNKRRKAKFKLARMHERISNQRNDFLHKVTSELAKNHSLIAMEDLRIGNMLKNHRLAKYISDASWNSFMQMLRYKASSAGSRVICIDPRSTSQICSNCTKEVKKDLSVRMHRCPYCGISIHRDLNAAINILNRATAGRAGSEAHGDFAPTLLTESKASRIRELGTRSYK